MRLTAVRRFDRVEMPEELFGTVNEGGVGRHWTSQTEERIKSLDWP